MAKDSSSYSYNFAEALNFDLTSRAGLTPLQASSMAMNTVQQYAMSSMRSAMNTQAALARIFKGVSDIDQAEIKQKVHEIKGNPEEVVDGLIDICVFAIGTLDVFEVDTNTAWNNILNANMAKETGVKPGRPNPWGLPDMMKPGGWQPPSHEGNHGHLPQILK